MSRIGLIGNNSIDYITILIKIWNNKDCAVLLDPRTPFQTAIEMMKEAGVSKCFIENGVYKKFEVDMYSSIDYIIYEKHNNSAELLPKYIYDSFQENYSKNEAVVIYSSGTTGKAKGIILSHFAINTNADAIFNYMDLSMLDCIYIAKPLTHSSTLTGELLVAIKNKIKVVISPVIVPPSYLLNTINKYNVSILCLNPFLLDMLSMEYTKANKSYDISSLRTIYVSGSILNDRIYNKARVAFLDKNIFNVYGLSEASPRVSAQRSFCCKTNSVGKAIDGVKIIIVDSFGKEVFKGQKGIVHVETPSLFNGYIQGETKHKSLYKNWLNTGDIGYWDTYDELHIVGRIDEVINVSSHKIYPCEIENIILRYKNIESCVVYGTVDNDNKVIIKCRYTSQHKIDHLKLFEFCMKHLIYYEIPSVFIKDNNLKRNKNGKISRKYYMQLEDEYVNQEEKH